MAVATATAFSGQVCTQRRAWTMSRGCWRLVVLLGLAWVALLLLGGTAHAAPAGDETAPPGPAAPGPVPLLGKTLAKVGALTASLPVDDVVRELSNGSPTRGLQPVADVVESSTATVASATDTAAQAASAAAAAAPASLPVADGLDAVTSLADSVRTTAEATAAEQNVLDVEVPSIAAAVVPVVAATAEQIDTTAQLVADTLLSAPLPVARPLHATFAPVVAAIDRATDVVTATSSLAATAVDGVVSTTTQLIAPVLAVVSSPAGSIAVSGPGNGSSAGSVPVGQPVPGTVPDSGPHQPTQPSAMPRIDDRVPDGTHGRPTVPPPDAAATSIDVVAQPASDIATVLPVPVSGAGSTTGNGGGAPTPVTDQTLVRVESEPEIVDDTTDPIEGPTGPMPGTPADDPAFSPD